MRKRAGIFGVGVNDWLYSCHKYVDGKKVAIKEYVLWKGVIERCYSRKLINNRPTYESVKCDPSWLSMTNFINDVSCFVGYDKAFTDGWELDKDILSPEEKVYSKETCCFVPPRINTVLLSNSRSNNGLPVGVSLIKKSGKFQARCRLDGVERHLGVFDTPEEASVAYKQYKKLELLRLADVYKDDIDERVYDALCNYQF